MLMHLRVPIVLAILLLLGGACRLPADTTDPGNAYFRGYLLKNDAERLEKAGDISGAVQKYREASQIFREIARTHPLWQPEVVQYRLKATGETIFKLCAQAGLPVLDSDTIKPVVPPITPAQTPSPGWELLNKQFEALKTQQEFSKRQKGFETEIERGRALDELRSKIHGTDQALHSPIDPGIRYPH